MAGPNFDPAQPLPDEFQSTVQTVPLLPAQQGAFLGIPSDPNPAETARRNAEAQALLAQNPALMPGVPLGPEPVLGNRPSFRIDEPFAINATPEIAPIGNVVDGTVQQEQAPPSAPKPKAKAPVAKAPAETVLGDSLLAPHENTPAEDAAEIGAAQVTNARELGKLAEVEAEKKVVELQRQQQEQLTQERLHQYGVNEAVRIRDEARNEVKNFKFHDFWEGKSTGSFLMSRLGIVLGGLSIDGPTKNEALEQMGNAIKQEFQQQEINLKVKQQLAADASTDVVELTKRFADEDARLVHRQSQALLVLAAQADQLASKTKSKIGENEAQKVALDLRNAAAIRSETALKSTSDLATAVATREHIKHQNRALDAQAYHAMQAGKAASSSDGMTPAERKQNRALFNSNAQKEATRIGREFAKPHDEATKALTYLDSQPNNPEAWIGARDFYVKAISGGKVTQAQYKQAAEHGAPGFDKLNQIFESIGTGLPSATQRKNLRLAVKALVKVTGDQLKEEKTKFEDSFGTDPLVSGNDVVAKPNYDRLHKSISGGLSEATKPSALQIQQAKQAAADPNAPKAVKDQAQLVLKAAGL